jgi:hypothetical protein
MSRTEQNTHASRNGYLAEHHAQETIPGAVWLFGEYDGKTKDGIPFDVKACEIIHNRSDLPHAVTRTGQMTLRREQHDELCRLGGFYFCCVIDSGIVVKEFSVPAVNVIFGEASQTKAVAWTTFAKMAAV